MGFKPKAFHLTLALFIAAGLVIGAGAGFIYALTRDLPEVAALEDFAPSAATRVLDAEGGLLTEFFVARRLPVPLSQIPEHLVQAVIAIEDRRFFEHPGMDVIRNFGALLHDIRNLSLAQGGSTITQQLAKNLFLSPEKTITRKLKELFLAFQIERRYSKDEILGLYLNQIFFGAGAYGVEAAAQTYFGRQASQLSLAEAALIAGLPKSPMGYSPYNHPDRAVKRRNLVLGAMVQAGYLSQEARRQATAEPLILAPRRLERARAPYFCEMVRGRLIELFGWNQVYRGGLTVLTTLDPTLSQAAETAVKNGAARLAKIAIPAGAETPQAALVALEPGTGRVLALAGGVDFTASPYDRARLAQRQPGSAFKPIIYATAIASGKTQADQVWDAPLSLDLPGRDEPWRPQNYTPGFLGSLTLRRALEVSQNVPAIRLLMEIGLDPVIETARALGLATPLGRNPSLALGAHETRLIELTAAYNTFASSGLYIQPWAIFRVLDRTGAVIHTPAPARRAALTAQTAFIITDMLGGVIQNGTGRAARALNAPLAGKTGTTNEYYDALFVGYSSTVTAGVWTGYDSHAPMGRAATGAGAALPIWMEFMETAIKTRPPEPFTQPAGIEMKSMDLVTGRAAPAGAQGAVMAAFRRGSGPR